MSRRHKQTEVVPLFSYYESGDEVYVNPDPPSPTEALPFHVVIRSKGWIPVSILVFARDEQHARSRVRTALVECIEAYKRVEHLCDYPGGRDFAPQYLDALNGKTTKEKLWVEVRQLSTDLICASVNWASNGGPL